MRLWNQRQGHPHSSPEGEESKDEHSVFNQMSMMVDQFARDKTIITDLVLNIG